jgi:hypothetical protein
MRRGAGLLIHADKAEDIAITGEGVLDGNGKMWSDAKALRKKASRKIRGHSSSTLRTEAKAEAAHPKACRRKLRLLPWEISKPLPT